METQSSLSCSPDLTTGPCLKADESS